jgi:hypothetical protein
LALPYRDDFEDTPVGAMPRYSLDQAGAFEVARLDGRGVLKQVVTERPVDWWDGRTWRMPYTVLGDTRWTDYRAGVDVSLASGGHALVSARGTLHQRDGAKPPSGYQVVLVVFGAAVTFSRGRLKGFDRQVWHRLEVLCKGAEVEGWVDGRLLAKAVDGSLASGQVALGCDYGEVTGGPRTT